MRGFRGDIEGLRAIAVSSVVVFHAFPSWLPGGFTGVDVFFVISGYLITRLLLAEAHDTGTIDLVQFWARRIRRILPAATLVLGFVAAGILLFPALDARELGRHVIAAGLFYYNLRQAKDGSDYLAADHRDNPMLHYWSLAVEEQFYVVWPVLLALIVVACQRWRSRGAAIEIGKVLIWMIAAVWIASFAYSVHQTETSASVAFYSPLSRSWQLLTGAFIAAIEPRLTPFVSRTWGQWLGAIGLCGLASSFAFLPGGFAYPGFVAAMPTFATAMIIAGGSATPTALSRQALSFPWLRYVGQISFSLYLWHWPMLVFGRLAFGDGIAYQWPMIVLAFGLAALTYRFIEAPIRFSPRLAASAVTTYAFGATLIGAATVAGFSLKHFGPDVVPIGNGQSISGSAIKNDRPPIYADRCLLRFADVVSPPCVYGDASATRTVVLYGDSHAGNWFGAIDAAARADKWRLVVRIKASCRPIDTPQTVSEGGQIRDYPECVTWRRSVFDDIALLKPDLIVVAGTGHDFGLDRELAVIAELAAVGPTLVMRDTPWFPEGSFACLRRTRDPAACQWPLASIMSANAYPRSSQRAMPPNATILDLNDLICPDGICRSVTDGGLVMFDNHHLTLSFSAKLGERWRDILGAKRDIK